MKILVWIMHSCVLGAYLSIAEADNYLGFLHTSVNFTFIWESLKGHSENEFSVKKKKTLFMLQVMKENARGQRRQARLVWNDRKKESHNSNNRNQDMQKTIAEHTSLKADGLKQFGTAQGAACLSLEGKSYISHLAWQNLTIEE